MIFEVTVSPTGFLRQNVQPDSSCIQIHVHKGRIYQMTCVLDQQKH